MYKETNRSRGQVIDLFTKKSKCDLFTKKSKTCPSDLWGAILDMLEILCLELVAQ